ncbi:MAG TPA: protein translocase subunit SecD [Chthoniobacteraceae bacterium]|jgi:SecD/SecF fusion protein
MNPTFTFLFGLLLLVLFGWYFFSESERAKRYLGSILTILLTAFCLQAVIPPFDVRDANGKLLKSGKIQLGLDLKGGTSFLIRLIAVPDEKGQTRPITPSMVDQAVEVIRKRVDQLGTSEPVITPSGTDRILVQIPGLDPQRLEETRGQLKKVAKLEFRLVHPQSSSLIPQLEAGQEVPPIGHTLEVMSDEVEGKTVERKLLIKKKADLLGETVTGASAYYDAQGWGVTMTFNSTGAEQFRLLTKQVANENSAMAIVLDGKIQSAPTVDGGKYPEGIAGGQAQISGGSMSEKEARNLASALENPLATPVSIEEERSASASLGEDSIKSGIYAGLLGLALIWAAVLFYYRLAGLVALIALAIEGVLLFGILSLFGAVLTLPGIAGTILTLGMAIDANVLIYERLREEVATGKTLKAALDAAYRKAFSAIFDSHVTTLITAAILYWMATGPVKGFAVTLTIGIIASMFTALIITRNLFLWLFEFNLLRKISMADLIGKTRVDFLGQRRIATAVSVLAMVALSIVFALRGASNFGVDFRGGDRLVMEAQAEKVPEDAVRQAIVELNIPDSVVQTEKSATSEFLVVRTPVDQSPQVDAHLKSKFPQANFRTVGTEKVGSVVGQELVRNSLIALGLGLVGIMIYVAIQFEVSFAVSTLIALVHDLIITIGIYSLAGREISLIFVGAVLTIAGYSVSDTIVVFDRIREGIRSGRGGSISQIMNTSINDTLSRTLLTGGTTLLAVAALYFLGGPTLNDFAFAIFVGVLVGTYSSIYIAAPLVLWWSGKGGSNLRREVKQAEALKPAVVGS